MEEASQLYQDLLYEIVRAQALDQVDLVLRVQQDATTLEEMVAIRQKLMEEESLIISEIRETQDGTAYEILINFQA